MKILFLDVDGVLNNEETENKTPIGYIGIMDSKVKLLSQIIENTGTKVVISSDWRLCYNEEKEDYQYLIDKLQKCGIQIFDKTPDLMWQRRGLEIETWLNKHEDVESWVVLDDIYFNDFGRKQFNGHLVITDGYYGLQQTDVDKAIRILNGG